MCFCTSCRFVSYYYCLILQFVRVFFLTVSFFPQFNKD